MDEAEQREIQAELAGVGDVITAAELLSPSTVQDVKINLDPISTSSPTELLGAMISAIRACLEEVERRAPLELAGRIATHGPMRDERDLAGAYVELREVLQMYFGAPPAPAADEPSPDQ